MLSLLEVVLQRNKPSAFVNEPGVVSGLFSFKMQVPPPETSPHSAIEPGHSRALVGNIQRLKSAGGISKNKGFLR